MEAEERHFSKSNLKNKKLLLETATKELQLNQMKIMKMLMDQQEASTMMREYISSISK